MAPRPEREDGKAKRWINNGGTGYETSDMYTYNRDIYIYVYIYCIYIYVCMYILLNGVNAYLTFGTGFSFFHFFPLLYVVCFSFVILRGTVFRGHPVNAFCEIRFECTHSHTQCCSCVYAIGYFGIWLRGTKGNREATASPIAGQ